MTSLGTDEDRIRDQLASARAEAEALIRTGRLGTVDELRHRYPAVWESADAILELIYAEYVLRCANGETPDRADWVRRYPDWSDRLDRLFGLYDLMAGDTHRPAATVGPDRPTAKPPIEDGHPDGYEVLGELGRGGMAVVYRARHRQLNRVVALKVLRWGDWDAADDARRVRREAELVARLQHPNVVQVYEVGEWDGDPFLALEFVPGGTLADALARLQKQGQTGVSTAEAVAMVGVLAGAVQAAHEQGVVHRDLKPANVLLADDPAGPFARPKVTDFGLAVSSEVSSAVTQTAALAGTPCYMAPEQAAANRAAIAPRTDVYALGGILYELLTGRPPFQGATVLETLDLVRHAEPVSPRLLRPHLPRDLETICLKCLSKEPARRYESAAALADDLARFRDGKPILARPVGRLEKGWKWCRRRPWLAGLAASLLLAVTLGVAGVTREYLRAEDEGAKAVERLKQIELINGTVFDIFADLDLEQVRADDQPVEVALAQKLIAAGKKLDATVIADPLVLAKLRDRLGLTLINLDEAAAAIDLLAEAWELRKTHLGPDHADTLATQMNLSEAHLAAGRLDQALPLAEDAHARCQAHLGADKPQTLSAAGNLANLYHQSERLTEALPLYEDTLRRSETRLGLDDPKTLATMSNLGMAYRDAGRPDDALRLLQMASDRERAKYGEGSPKTLITLNNLALVHDHAGRRQIALELFERILAIEQAEFGDSHKRVLIAMNNLATTYQDDGQMEKALHLLKEALKRKKVRYGLDDPTTLTGMYNLANAYKAVGDREQAIPLYQQALALRKERLGADHDHTLLVMNNLAMCYESDGQYDKAVELFAETHALQVAKPGKGPDHPETLLVLNNLARCLRAAGRPEKALPLHQKVVELQRAKTSPDHPNTHRYMTALADGYDALGRFDESAAVHREKLASVQTKSGRESAEYATAAAAFGKSLLVQKKWADAEPLLREALAIREKKQPDHWLTFQNRGLLGAALLGQKKHADAEPLLLAGYEGMKAREDKIPKSGGSEQYLPDALDWIIQLYTATNKPDEVKKFMELRAKYPELKPSQKKL